MWDRFVGPDATRGEQALVLVAGIAFSLGLVGYVRTSGFGWTPLQQTLVALLALDVAGGIVANTTRAGSRWWHRPSQGARQQFVFVAGHLHPFLLAWLFAGVSWAEAPLTYGFILASAAIILTAPRHGASRLRR